jgi:hypothetical protein
MRFMELYFVVGVHDTQGQHAAYKFIYVYWFMESL